MKIEVNIGKKYFFAFVLIGLIFIGIVGVIAYGTNNPQVFGHSAGEINWDDAISKNVIAAGFCIGTNCVTDWNSLGGEGGGSSQWTSSGNNIYNSNSGNVGIGTGTALPSAKLHIVGDLKVDGVIKGDASGNVIIKLGP